MATVSYSWPFRSELGETPAQARDEEDSIAESIERILSTPKGARVMRNAVGLNTLRYLFENNDPNLEDAVRFEVVQALSKYEPRIVVTQVTTQRIESDLNVRIEYIVRATQQADILDITV